MDKTTIGDRLKTYEDKNSGDANLPIIVRIDGKGFSKWTKRFEKPFDEILSSFFQQATLRTMETIGQCVFAYSQSDEVSILLDGWRMEESQQWFGGKYQKISSVTASIFTAHFNDIVREHFNNVLRNTLEEIKELGFVQTGYGYTCATMAAKALEQPVPPLAYFDARTFSLPEEEVRNYFFWRQMDAKRNSIHGYARSFFSHKQLHGKNTSDMMTLMKVEKFFDWNELPSYKKWGFVVEKHVVPKEVDTPEGKIEVNRNEWKVNLEIPYFFTRELNFERNNQ